jgi:hypothetical protein
MANTPKSEAKRDFPRVLEESFGIIGRACRTVKIDYQTYYDWRDKDPEFKEATDQARILGKQAGGDFAENCLFTNMKNGKEASLLFYLKTQHRDRGYVEKHDDDKEQRLYLDLSTLSQEQLDRQLDRCYGKNRDDN